MTGLEVHYTNYHLEDIDTLTPDERKGQIMTPPVKWFQTILVVEMNTARTMRPLFRDNFPPRYVTERNKE